MKEMLKNLCLHGRTVWDEEKQALFCNWTCSGFTVLFTGHQAFLTAEALTSISQTTLQNLSNLEKGETCPNELV